MSAAAAASTIISRQVDTKKATASAATGSDGGGGGTTTVWHESVAAPSAAERAAAKPIAFIDGRRVSMADAAVYMQSNGLIAAPTTHGSFAIPLDTGSGGGAPRKRRVRKERSSAAPHVLGERCAICALTTRGTPTATRETDGQPIAAATNAVGGRDSSALFQPLTKRPRRDTTTDRKRSDRAVFAVYDAGSDGDEDGSAVAAAMSEEKGAAAIRVFRCWECGNAYHSQCFVPPLNVRAAAQHLPNWFCPVCKPCTVCKLIGNPNPSATATATATGTASGASTELSNELLVCDTCDRGFHTDCLTPNRAAIRTAATATATATTTASAAGGGASSAAAAAAPPASVYGSTPLFIEPEIFICPDCVYCHDCNRRTPGDSPDSKWEFGSTLCEECAISFTGSVCGVCQTPYDEADAASAEQMWLACDFCDLWIHAACEAVDEPGFQSIGDAGAAQKYKCLRCRSGLPRLTPAPTAPPSNTDESNAAASANAPPPLIAAPTIVLAPPTASVSATQTTH